MRTYRRVMMLCLAPAALMLGCGEAEEQAPEPVAESSSEATAPPAERPASDWNGAYAVRGTLEGNQVSGTLNVSPLAAGAPTFEETRQRVQRTYPTYQGPFYTAELRAASGPDTINASFTCAHGPAETPPLVCDPITAIPGLEHATLVVQPNGSAVLTGSHGEGVSVESGRFTWSRQGSS